MRSVKTLLYGALAAATVQLQQQYPLAQAQHLTLDMRVMTWNIRYATTNPGENEQPWSVRRPLLAAKLDEVTAARPDMLLCFQEVLHAQVLNLEEDLGDEWARIGVGRDDGITAGEYSPIFYRKAAWELQESKTYWLSETPDVPGSVGWDASLPRIATVARFRNLASGADFVQMCTHFDHLGQVARENSAKLLVDVAGEWSDKVPGTPVFLGGDLNVTPDNQAYKTLATLLTDVKDAVPESAQYGPEKTYTGFLGDPDEAERIDFIFVRDPKSVHWTAFGVLESQTSDGTYISDHRPVVVDFTL